MKVFSVVLACFSAAIAFNVDVNSCVRYRGPSRGSMFGFAVQEHVEKNEKMVLIGAPKDDPRRRPNLERPGAVYRCRIDVEDDCRELIFDYNSNNNDTNYRQIDQKSNQWFGATLASAGANGPVVACSPRYVSFVTAKLNHREPVGSCFVAKNGFSVIDEYSPCRTSNYGYHRTGVCQAGFGAALSKDGSKLFMGAPGSYYWQGQAFSIDTSLPGNNFYWPRHTEGQLYSQDLASRPKMLATAESTSVHDDSYLGYSVAVIYINKLRESVAVGMPRGADLRGKVVIYTAELENLKNVSGSQIGAYFGYSVAAGDIDGDGLDDLVVGAPMYTVPNNEGAFEQGRVYVIYQGRADRLFKLNDYRTGEVSRGRFGLSLAFLGDINLDGFGDFAVGAPYGGIAGNGVVYLYYGSKDGVREKYSQVITAEEVAPGMTTFGWSLSGGLDMDGNQYNDLVVGAYESDMAVFFKARPVVRVTASVVLDAAESKEISLEDKRCTLRSGERVACMDVNYCLQYDGINVDRHIEFDLVLILDSLQKRSKRIFFTNDESNHTFNRTITINRQEHWCGSSKVYIKSEVRDKLTPLQVTMEYNLKQDRYSSRNYIPPVLDLTVGNSMSDAVNISKNCGPDKICYPDLRMDVEPTVARYMLGSQEKLGINVFVKNVGEDAFEAAYYLTIPPGVHFVKTESLETGRSTKAAVHCSTPVKSGGGNSTLKCDIGNPLESNQMVNFKVLLQPSDLDTTSQKYEFRMETNSTNPERAQHRFDNVRVIEVGVFVDTNVSIIGVSLPPELHYNVSLYQTDASKQITRDVEFGPHVVHAYNVKNNGPSFVEEAEMFVIWPYQTLAGEDFFYLLSQPETSGNIKCDMADHVNERFLTIDRKNQQYFLPQIIQGLETDRLISVQNTQNFQSEEEKRQFMLEHERQFTQNAGSQSSIQHTQTSNTNSGRTQAVYNQASGSQGSSGSQYGTSITNSGQYGSGSGQSSSSSSHYGSGSQSGISRQHGSSHGQASDSGRYGSSGQYGSGSGQEGSNFGQYGSSSGQYGSSANRYGNVNTGGARGSGHQYTITKERNTTIDIDEHGRETKIESSTEYLKLGHEGEAGSSWNNRYGASSATNQQGHRNENWQSGHAGASQSNVNSQSGHVGAGSSHGGSRNLGWSTEESVNKNLFNAGSSASVLARGESEIEETVGGEEEPIGGFANVVVNPNHEFRTVFSDVDAASSGSSAGSYGSKTAHSGGSRSGSAYAGSGGEYSGSEAIYSGGRSEVAHSGGKSEVAHSGGRSGAAYGGSAQRGGSSQSSYSSQGYSGASQSSGSSYYQSKQSAGGFSASSSGGESQQWQRRNRRQTEYVDIDRDVALVFANCTNNFKCAIIRCVTGALQKNQDVWMSIQGRINARFLNEMTKENKVLVTTVAAARVSKLSYVGRPTDAPLATFQATTHVTPQVEPTAKSIELWQVVLAAVAGALLLLLLIFALYKCGFFKRNRPTDHAERQPLNRNGYHGDEHL